MEIQGVFLGQFAETEDVVTNVQSGGNVISRDKYNSYNSLIPRDPNLMLKLEATLEQPKAEDTDLMFRLWNRLREKMPLTFP